MPKNQKIYWTGYGCLREFVHTKAEFLSIMTGQFPEKLYVRRKGDPKGIPVGKIRMNDVQGWMEFADAHWV